MNLGINFTQIQPLLNEVYDWSVENLKSGMLHDGNVRNIGCIIIYCKLIDMARKKGDPINYDPIAEIMGKSPGESMRSHRNWVAETGDLLGEICDFEHSNGRPMLSALVIRADTEEPGKGFFDLARQLGKLKSVSKHDETAFWEQELQAVYAAWK